MEIITKFIDKNGLVFAFLVIGVVMYLSDIFSKKVLHGKLPTAAVAVVFGLVLAYIGGVVTLGEKGISDLKLFSSIGILGGSMFRDFAIVSTAFGASIMLMKKSGWVGALSLAIGILISFSVGFLIAFIFGYRDAISLTTIAAGACTYIVGPVTGAALGASSDIIALSIATGVVKVVGVAVTTPIIAKRIGLDNPHSAMVFGGMMGTNAGVMAGLAATDPKLVPYGALTATFYTGLGCLVCPSVFYILIKQWVG